MFGVETRQKLSKMRQFVVKTRKALVRRSDELARCGMVIPSIGDVGRRPPDGGAILAVAGLQARFSESR